MEKHIFKKKYGQNFLQDQNILRKIHNSISPTENDLILEVGPGSGNLTKYLKEYNANIICYEIDESLKETLHKLEDEKTKVKFGDFMETNIMEDIKDYKYNDLYVIANIPYYITTPIIKKVTFETNPKGLVLMVQKEVADRLSANEKSKEYGYITVMLNYFYDIDKLFNVPRGCFYPVPNVDSAIIKLTPNNREKTDFEKFNKLIEQAFMHKRKNLKNNLKNYNLELLEQELNKHGYSLSNRAEEIPVDIYIELSKVI